MAKEEIFPIDENDTDVCVTLELENGESLDCEILVIYDVEDVSYIALMPVDESGNPFNDQEAILYRYAEAEDGSPMIDNIESEEEYEIAAAAFDAIQDEEFTEE
ncbi:Protein of unknown function [Lachnospiraceae bacterium C10]|jgi:hypothetical protein|nr:DUF1292 domain-containing protein [Lachnospiraceae bacterium]SCW28674.1 Protein of unknown function [Lachnospiraceae bacterium C10]SDW00284.1 Protein of unknown function [Lachnospiraceae bacterium KHCPX20]